MQISWLQIGLSFFGGSLMTYLITLFIQSGRLEVIKTYAKISCSAIDFAQYINYFDLEIQFINRSTHLRVISNIMVTFFDGEKKHNLKYKDYNVPPAATIEGRKEKLLKYILLPPMEKFELPLLSLYHDNSAYLQISYLYKKKIIEITISGEQIAHEDNFKPIAG